jgi:hypothetical protein
MPVEGLFGAEKYEEMVKEAVDILTRRLSENVVAK